jgi:16S rRNA pseudouridine516 synthase
MESSSLAELASPHAIMANLEKLLARNLRCSRREARKMLAAEGRAWPEDIFPAALPFTVELAGRSIALHDSFHLMLNKPAGCVTALSDPSHKTAASFVRDAPLADELRAVGRLDLDTTGLLLWTTDGDWLHRLTHPRTAVPRGYHAALARPFAELPRDFVLRDGHKPQVLELRALREDEPHPSLARPPEASVFATVTIAGGAYHEVRRIFAALGSHVLSLCRVSFGSLHLPRELSVGRWQAIRQDSVVADDATI